MLDEGRRASYKMSSQPIGRSESIFMTFDSEMKQLVAVCITSNEFFFLNSWFCFTHCLIIKHYNL